MSLLNKVKIENMINNKGNTVKNQFIIHTNDGVYFQSYKSIIAFIDNRDNVYLDSYYWDYSVTTSKYRNQFLKTDTQDTKKGIAEGMIKLVDLNQ